MNPLPALLKAYKYLLCNLEGKGLRPLEVKLVKPFRVLVAEFDTF
jgi:hypothetical protein